MISQTAVSDELLPNEPPQSGTRRGHMIALSLGWFGVFAQVLAIIHVVLIAPKFRQMFADFGLELSTIATTLLATYPLWGAIPVLSATLLYVVSRGEDERPSLLWPVVMGILSAAILLEAWTVWALYAPLWNLHAALS